MRKIAATWVFPVSAPPVPNGCITLDEEGYVLQVSSLNDGGSEKASVEFYNGILVPGFVNSHTHLEFSWCRQVIPMHNGLPGFLKAILAVTPPSPEVVVAEMQRVMHTMYREGTVAAGDIMNSPATLSARVETPFPLHTFIELLDLPPSHTSVWQKGMQMFETLHRNTRSAKVKNTASIVPHAPYTVSELLFRQIASFARKTGSPISIHNQETSSENTFFCEGKGELANALREMNVPVESRFQKKPSALHAILPLLPEKNNILLVHNTFTREEDVEYALSGHPHLFWVLCPNANLYIENHLPPVHLLRKKGCSIAIGTDSFASNYRLSILDELKTLSIRYPQILLEELLYWACLNGARALGMERYLGSISPGKKPGIVLIENADHTHLRLTPFSTARRMDC